MAMETAPRRRREFDAIVIGGGLVGAAIAHGLQCGAGLATALLDEGDVAYRASRGNFGLVWVQSKGLGAPWYQRWTRASAAEWPALAADLAARAAGTDVGLRQPGGVLDILSAAAATIAEGEVLQLVTQNDTATTEAQYLEVIEGKTAALFAAATEIGAVVTDRPEAEAEALRAYGRNLGMAFQLVDDALDYSAVQAELGKTVGDDFREGKITLPVLLAFARGDEEERGFWRRTLEGRAQQEGDLARALGLMQRHGALRDTVARARGYGDAALAALGTFADGAERQALAEIVRFCIDRAR